MARNSKIGSLREKFIAPGAGGGKGFVWEKVGDSGRELFWVWEGKGMEERGKVEAFGAHRSIPLS